MEVGGQRHSSTSLPLGKTQYPLYMRLGELQPRSGRVRKISPLSRFDRRTTQPAASRYTDWAIPAQNFLRQRAIQFFCRLVREPHVEKQQ